MGWGRAKPFWQSKAWKKSKAKGTGIFSWGDSDYLKLIPGVGGQLDTLADKLGETSGTKKSVFEGPKPAILSAEEGQGLVLLGAGLVLYLLLK